VFILLFLLSNLFKQLRELRVGVIHQLLRGIILQVSAMREYQDTITGDNRVETMGNDYHSRLFELFRDELLDLLFCFDVDVSRCFVKEDNFILLKDGPTDTNQLFLSTAEVSASIFDLIIKTTPFIFLIFGFAIE
jgi:hypothetical protein